MKAAEAGVSEPVGKGVYRIPFFEVNAYLVGEPGGPWAVVDTATENRFDAIREAAETVYGRDARPGAIYLTHGHQDHSGSALALATYWGVPVYIHRAELPFVTGQADYPPPDPTTGGAFALLSRFMKIKRMDLGDSVHPLPETGLPGMPGWEAIPTPGHSPGHIAYWHPERRILLAGDACATVDADDWSALLTGRQKLVRPASPTTPDWEATRKSLKRLAELQPLTIAAGHGQPLSGGELPENLSSLAEDFIIPLKGRYVSAPARYNENGVDYLPPAPRDPLPGKVAAAAGVAALLGLGVLLRRQHRRQTEEASHRAKNQRK